MKIKDYKLSELKEICITKDYCKECPLYNKDEEGCEILNHTPQDWFIDVTNLNYNSITYLKSLLLVKTKLTNKFNYYGELRNKNIEYNTKASRENALYDLGAMTGLQMAIDNIDETISKYTNYLHYLNSK